MSTPRRALHALVAFIVLGALGPVPLLAVDDASAASWQLDGHFESESGHLADAPAQASESADAHDGCDEAANEAADANGTITLERQDPTPDTYDEADPEPDPPPGRVSSAIRRQKHRACSTSQYPLTRYIPGRPRHTHARTTRGPPIP